jgi:hypothetical protein
MASSRRWSVESKEFELVVKGGAQGVRIFERSHGKQRSIFLKKDELVWLERTVEEMVLVESSEVFWDQSRAGYPRVIAQRRSNRHGSFLTVEEFDGRRRCGTILILKEGMAKGGNGSSWNYTGLTLPLFVRSETERYGRRR